MPRPLITIVQGVTPRREVFIDYGDKSETDSENGHESPEVDEIKKIIEMKEKVRNLINRYEGEIIRPALTRSKSFVEDPKPEIRKPKIQRRQTKDFGKDSILFEQTNGSLKSPHLKNEKIRVIQQRTEELQKTIGNLVAPPSTSDYVFYKDVIVDLLTELGEIESEGDETIKTDKQKILKTVQECNKTLTSKLTNLTPRKMPNRAYRRVTTSFTHEDHQVERAKNRATRRVTTTVTQMEEKPVVNEPVKPAPVKEPEVEEMSYSDGSMVKSLRNIFESKSGPKVIITSRKIPFKKPELTKQEAVIQPVDEGKYMTYEEYVQKNFKQVDNGLVFNEAAESSESENERPEPIVEEKSDEMQEKITEALFQITVAREEAEEMKEKVLNLTSVEKDAAYQFIEEGLIRIAIKLDNVETCHDDAVRNDRREVIVFIDNLNDMLKDKLEENRAKRSDSSDSSESSDGGLVNGKTDEDGLD